MPLFGANRIKAALVLQLSFVAALNAGLVYMANFDPVQAMPPPHPPPAAATATTTSAATSYSTGGSKLQQ